MSPHKPTAINRKDALALWADLFFVSPIEIRSGRGGPNRGTYFTNKEAACRHIAKKNDIEGQNCYFTLNQIGELSKPLEKELTNLTDDIDIVRYRWIPIDFDPVRGKDKAGMRLPSSDEELAQAYAKAMDLKEWLAGKDWPEPVVACSGNGYHLLYRADLPASDQELVELFVKQVSSLFSDSQIKLDTAIYNPARIFRVYGTTNRKGAETDDRPHRDAHIMSYPQKEQRRITASDIRSLFPAGVDAVTTSSPSSRPHRTKAVSVKKIRDRKAKNDVLVHAARLLGLEVEDPDDYRRGRKWVMKECPLDSTHEQNFGSTVLIESEVGHLHFKCSHDRCSHWRIEHVKDLVADLIDQRGVNDFEVVKWREAYFRSCEEDGKPRVFFRNTEPEGFAREVVYHLKAQKQLFQSDGEICKIKKSGREGPERLMLSREDFAAEISRNMSVVSIMDLNKKNAVPWLKHSTIKRDIGTIVYSVGRDELPALDRLVNTPFFTGNGRLVCEEGYDPVTRTFYAPHHSLFDVDFTDLPTSLDAARSSLRALRHPFRYFPFDNASSLAHHLSCILQQFMVELIDDKFPAVLYDAIDAGSGKTLLAESAKIIGTGSSSMLSEPKDKNELKKRIDTRIMAGETAIIVDNVSSRLNNDDLLKDITSEWLMPRILGSSKIMAVRNKMTWMFTANRTKLFKDMARRTVPVLLRPDTENPSQNNLPPDATNDDKALGQYLKRHRAVFVKHCLTIIGAWLKAGAPKSSHYLGSFIPWAASMGGLLRWVDAELGEAFLATFAEHVENVDDEKRFWRETIAILIQAIEAHDLNFTFTAGEARKVLDEAEHLPWDVRDKATSGQRAQNQAMGYWLKSKTGPVNGGRFDHVPTSNRSASGYRFSGGEFDELRNRATLGPLDLPA